MEELSEVLKSIKPTAAGEKSERAFVARIMDKLRAQGKGTKVVLAGSFAKGTFLEGDKDVDIFVLFRHNVEKEALESIVRAMVENAFPGAKLVKGNAPPLPGPKGKIFYQIAYAQHPYVRVFLEGRKIDVVPAYEAAEGRHFEPRSAVDRSQLHTEYVLAKMSPKQKDEVRLLKKFLKSNMLYGAEIRVQGFSGYLCELLILKYGTFAKTMESAAAWGPRTFVGLEGAAKQDDSFKKFETPLVAIDPVDPERNVSAVVSSENYLALIALARAFLKSKNKASFFAKKSIPAAQLRKLVQERCIYCLEFAAPDIVDDILWGQVRRHYCAFSTLMKKEGFVIIGSRMEKCGKSICMVFELLGDELPGRKIVLGPPLQFSKDCEKFSSQHGKGSLLIIEGRLAALVERKERTPEKLLKKIRALPLPSHLSSAKNAKLYKGAAAIKNCGAALEAYFCTQIK